MTEPSDDNRSPPWWNPLHWPRGLWAVVIGIIVMSTPFAIRTAILMTVPDIPEPFDVAEFSKWDVPDSENAVTYYRQASVLRAQALSAIRDVNSVRESGSCLELLTAGWSEVDEPNRNWLDLHQKALAVWRRGTQQAQGLYRSPSNRTIDGSPNDVVDQRAFARLAILHEARSLSEGNASEAYQWARAAFRGGGHISYRGPIIEGLTAAAIHSLASSGLAHWAQQPAVTSDQLRQALIDLRSDYGLYESPSNILKTEYLELRNTLQTPTATETLCYLHHNPKSRSSEGWIKVMRIGYWIIAEPELTLRINRQILANQINELDKPLAKRHKLIGTGPILLFDSDPNITLVPGQLAPAAIDRAINRSSTTRTLMPPSKLFDDSMLRQQAIQAMLEALLAVQVYRRDHGEFPETLPELVPNYLSVVPLDPFDPSGGPLLYRREEPTKAIVWSVGDDRADSGGTVDPPKGKAPDLGFVIK